MKAATSALAAVQIDRRCQADGIPRAAASFEAEFRLRTSSSKQPVGQRLLDIDHVSDRIDLTQFRRSQRVVDLAKTAVTGWADRDRVADVSLNLIDLGINCLVSNKHREAEPDA